jgi:hypothetical protein
MTNQQRAMAIKAAQALVEATWAGLLANITSASLAAAHGEAVKNMHKVLWLHATATAPNLGFDLNSLGGDKQ